MTFSDGWVCVKYLEERGSHGQVDVRTFNLGSSSRMANLQVVVAAAAEFVTNFVETCQDATVRITTITSPYQG